MFISHGGGAPSGIPRASLSSRDSIPGFISLSLTCWVHTCIALCSVSQVWEHRQMDAPNNYELSLFPTLRERRKKKYLKLLPFVVQVTMTSQFWFCLIFEEGVVQNLHKTKLWWDLDFLHVNHSEVNSCLKFEHLEQTYRTSQLWYFTCTLSALVPKLHLAKHICM